MGLEAAVKVTDTEQKALALVNEVEPLPHTYDRKSLFQSRPFKALLRAIEQHEQFKREVSDAVERLFVAIGLSDAHRAEKAEAWSKVKRFIMPKPVDPLVEACMDAWSRHSDEPGYRADIERSAAELRAALAKRGGKIVWENEP